MPDGRSERSRTPPTQWTMTARDPDGRPVDVRAHRPRTAPPPADGAPDVQNTPRRPRPPPPHGGPDGRRTASRPPEPSSRGARARQRSSVGGGWYRWGHGRGSSTRTVPALAPRNVGGAGGGTRPDRPRSVHRRRGRPLARPRRARPDRRRRPDPHHARHVHPD